MNTTVGGGCGKGSAAGPTNGNRGRKKGAKRFCETGRAGDASVWTQKQLTCLVWALGHKNQDVLVYTAWTV